MQSLCPNPGAISPSCRHKVGKGVFGVRNSFSCMIPRTSLCALSLPQVLKPTQPYLHPTWGFADIPVPGCATVRTRREVEQGWPFPPWRYWAQREEGNGQAAKLTRKPVVSVQCWNWSNREATSESPLQSHSQTHHPIPPSLSPRRTLLPQKQILYPVCNKRILTHSGGTLFYSGLGSRWIFYKSSTLKAGLFIAFIH